MTPRLLSIESPFPQAHGMLRLLEAPGSCENKLWQRLFDGTYDKPFIIDNRLRRFLHFDLDCVQSAMSWQNPYALSLAYTRRMMAFLLFNSAPRRILLLGLGGGSLAKFCHCRLPSAAVTAVEVNPDVIALREAFCIPADNDRFRVIRADGASYVAGLRRYKDVILADACDRSGIAPQFDAFEFYRNARRRLSANGVLVVNLCGDKYRRAAHVLKLRDAFGDECMTLQVGSEGNVIVFAFKERRPEIDWERFAAMAADLKRRFGLDFPRTEVAQMAAQPEATRHIRDDTWRATADIA
jgi:spermidine synthase